MNEDDNKNKSNQDEQEQKQKQENAPIRNKYLSICSRFRYPPELSTKQNYAKAQKFVDDYLTIPDIEITSPALKKLIKMVYDDPSIRMCFSRMVDEAYEAGNISKKPDTSKLIGILQAILQYSPVCNTDDPPESVTLPLAMLYGPLADTESGEILALRKDMNQFWFEYLAEYCAFLSSTDSAHVLNDKDGWLSPPGYKYMCLDECIIPDGGFKSWNEFFIRALKDGARKIDEKGNNTVITSPVDAQVWRYEAKVTNFAQFWVKGEPYDVRTLLGNDEQAAQYYLGGTVMQQVLFTENYHRWHAPVSGTITKVQLIRGAYFSNLKHQYKQDTSSLVYWTGSMPYMAHLNNRMVVEIDTNDADYDNKHGHGNVGRVTFIAVGLNEVSSVVAKTKTGEDLKVNDQVEKGDQLGYFQFGGSTVMCLFPPACIQALNFEPPQNPFEEMVKFKMGQQVATANLL